MHIHILGICGTFMGGIAALARAAGHTVSGSDAQAYPPMSEQLENLGIVVQRGYDPAHLDPRPDQVVIGNVMSRGNPAVEYVLDQGIDYVSGPQWLAEQVLRDRWVIAVAGTHGKTTTASMIASILHYAGLEPGFLIGGVAHEFGASARLGNSPFFVVEADEYDTAFFDKRSKFVHYRPRTLAVTNLEFDHADIFPALADIQRQFHHLVRTVPAHGLIVANAASAPLEEALALGCWTPIERFSSDPAIAANWQADAPQAGASDFAVRYDAARQCLVRWDLAGRHNRENALAAIAAARHAGVPVAHAADALSQFAGVRRRMEAYAEIDGVTLYDDFAHHPTEIAASLAALREKSGGNRVVAVFEPRSNSMKMGVHCAALAASFAHADCVWLFLPQGLTWDLESVAGEIGPHARVVGDIDALAGLVAAGSASGDHIALMSNGDFHGLHERLATTLGQARDARGVSDAGST